MSISLSLSTPAKAADFSTVKQQLAAYLRQLLTTVTAETASIRPIHPRQPLILRIEIPIKNHSPLLWLSNQKQSVQLYWSDRTGGFEMAGIGEADRITLLPGQGYQRALRSITHRLTHQQPHFLEAGFHRHAVESRYYGGLSFFTTPQDSARVPTHTTWPLFYNGVFILPRFEWLTDHQHAYFACNICWDHAFSDTKPNSAKPLSATDDLQRIIAELETLQPPATHWHEIASDCFQRQDIPTKAHWLADIPKRIEQFDEADIAKIVMGRSQLLQFTQPLHPMALLSRLKALEPHAYHFCVQLDKNQAFLGATPERLYKRSQRQLETEAVAGTCPRGASDYEAAVLAQQLLRSEKEQREHAFVQQHIQAVLAACCQQIHVRDTQVIKQARVQHLYTAFCGQLYPAITDVDILSQLHPTPAVSGFPVHQTVQKIAEWEAFYRGWFAGPIGWIGRDQAEFAVGIRSAWIRQHTIQLFAGAGIVNGSTAELEWRETQAKMSVLMAALDLA